MRRAAARGVELPFTRATPAVNTLPYPSRRDYPGDLALEARIEAMVRWNAMAMVARANRDRPGIGGHIASYASAGTLMEVGFNHFFRGNDHPEGPDHLYLQGHASPGVYARAFLEGRLDEEKLDAFRADVSADGLSSYPHPWLMPRFWETPSVSMGLAPLMAIYQARFDRYLVDRGLRAHLPRTWAVIGDGEMDEPESVGGLAMASRSCLGNLTFVVDCNLQRLDGPVRGDASVIRELEGLFRGAGWKVLKVLWGREWCDSIARDVDGRLVEALDQMVDGQWQRVAARGGAVLREELFDRDPALRAMVADWSDAELGQLERGGHDRLAVWSAFDEAARTNDRPTVILAMTVKGWGMGTAGEARNVAHQAKSMNEPALRAMRDRLGVPIGDAELDAIPYVKPDESSPELSYMRERREALGGLRPERRASRADVALPGDDVFGHFRQGSERDVTTTAWLVRMLAQLLKDPNLGPRIVPIVPDEARTFGLEALFPQVGIYAHSGQLYESVDAGKLLHYQEEREGQILEEGITEAGAMASLIAAGTSHASGGPWMLPFFFFYSMFGFQRVGDLIWAAQDARAHGFLIGATSGRTTLNGEGLQHQDGHSHLLAHAYPRVRAYDVAYGYEIATIVEEGIRRMVSEGEDVLYYITVANEPYPMPGLPEPDSARGHRAGNPLRPSVRRGPGHAARFRSAAPLGARGARAARDALRRDRRGVERDQLLRAPPRREHPRTGRSAAPRAAVDHTLPAARAR